MLDFVIFAVTFFFALIAAVIYLYPTSSKPTTVPGLEPSDPKEGNIPDIRKCGSLHEFLCDVHQKFGDIVSFWMGEQMVISICSPELFKEQSSLFDRPVELFKLFEPLIGPKSIQYANGAEGRCRRKLYDRCHSHSEIKNIYPILNKLSKELITKWSTMTDDEHIPLSIHMFALAMKSNTKASFGDFFNDKDLITFRKNYELVWTTLDNRILKSGSVSVDEKRYKDALEYLKSTIVKIISHRQNNPPPAGEMLLIDVILESDFDEETMSSDALTYLIGGYHTSGNILIWTFYFLASHPDVQERLYEELSKTIGKKDDVEISDIGSLKYLQQVVEESLRCSVIAPWAARYKLDTDGMLGGHIVPKGTPVIHALGVASLSKKYFPHPQKFDPERFSKEQTDDRPLYAFQPFGFAGKRKCPGYRLVYAELYVYIASIIRNFKIKMVADQVVNPIFGLVTHPEDEIWITVEERSK